MTELTFALLKYGFLILLWVFIWLAVRSLHKDIETFSPRPSRSRRRREREMHKEKAEAPQAPVSRATSSSAPVASGNVSPTLLVIIDGPLAGSSVPLTGAEIGLGRAASNTVVLDDEFVSSHHARVYRDPSSGQWAIEDLNSTTAPWSISSASASPPFCPLASPCASAPQPLN